MAPSKTLLYSFVLFLSLSMSSVSEARDFVVGGNKSTWKIPSAPDEFNKWASKNRFLINDSIVLKYDPKTDSVLEVSENDFKTCTTSNPIKSYNDGNSKITLDRSGPFYFISGAQGHCEKGQKVAIVVLSAKHGGGGHSVAPPPSETNDHHEAPAPSPHRNGAFGLKAGLLTTTLGIFMALA